MNGMPAFAFLDPLAAGLTPLLDGIILGPGRISLAEVPSGPQPLGGDLGAGALDGPAGIAAAPDGTLYFADPAHGRVLELGPCDAAPRPLPCVPLAAPRGVAVAPARDWLLVAEWRADRVLALHRDGGATRGPLGPAVERPTDLAVDAAQRVYVAAHGRVERMSIDGVADPAFAAAVAAARPAPRAPSHVAILAGGDGERLLVLDRPPGGSPRVLVFDLDGTPDEAAADAFRHALAGLGIAATPTALAAGPGGAYLADPAAGRILAFDARGHLLGSSVLTGACAGLTIDAQGRLVLHAGATATRFGSAGSGQGSFRIGPFPGGDRPAAWRRVQVLDAVIPDGAHVRLFTLTTDDLLLVPPPLPAGPAAPGDPWRPAAPGALDCFVGGPPARLLWIGGRLQAGPGGPPSLAGLRVEHDGDGWLRHLPAVYSRDDASHDLLDPALAALQSALDEEERLIDDLPLRYTPATVPDGDWLTWLAGWLAFDLEAGMDAATRRTSLAEAFRLEGLRGTALGLRRLVALLLGIEIDVVEPAAQSAIWSLGETGDGGLGFGTQLAAGEPDGAVLGTTATLGHSPLQDPDAFGSALCADLAHRFCVRTYAADLGAPGARAALARIVDRERPAHTVAHLCVVEPRARAGFQATVGVDAIVAAATPGRLGEAFSLEQDAELSGRPGRAGRIGETARVGAAARVA